MQKKIAIIGAGAAGCMAAITAARNNCIVNLFDGNNQIGKKILATGNGKCNISNSDLSDSFYFSESDPDYKFLHKILNVFSFDKTREFFEELGLYLTMKGTLAYPRTGQAGTVTFILENALKKENINLRLSERIKKIVYHKEKELFAVKTAVGEEYYDAVIIATGGIASSISGSDGDGYYIGKSFGHTTINTCPALVQLKCEGDYWKDITGVRCDASITISNHTEIGELQLTDYGISGYPVFQLSLLICRELMSKEAVTGYIDFIPELTKEELLAILDKNGEVYETVLYGLLHKKIAMLLIKLFKEKMSKKSSVLFADNIHTLISLMKEFSITVTGHNDYKNAQVTSGGIALTEVNEHLQSLKQKGLYFAGEVLDMTGKCGGYNLQWAWSSGYVAGLHASKNEE